MNKLVVVCCNITSLSTTLLYFFLLHSEVPLGAKDSLFFSFFLSSHILRNFGLTRIQSLAILMISPLVLFSYPIVPICSFFLCTSLLILLSGRHTALRVTKNTSLLSLLLTSTAFSHHLFLSSSEQFSN